jgi:hypothetical protein
MQTVYKYQLQAMDKQTIAMPVGAKILCVQAQNDVPCIWAIVDTEASLSSRHFATVGTGHPVHFSTDKYIGTYQIRGGIYIFHVFEI